MNGNSGVVVGGDGVSCPFVIHGECDGPEKGKKKARLFRSFDRVRRLVLFDGFSVLRG